MPGTADRNEIFCLIQPIAGIIIPYRQEQSPEPEKAVTQSTMQPNPTATSENNKRSCTLTAGKAVLAYLLLAGLWILLLDISLIRLFDDPARLLKWQAAKDALFICATALLLFFYLRHLLRKQRLADEAFQTIQRGTAGTIGQDYFQFLTENLPGLLQTDVCFVGEWDKAADTLKILAGHPSEIVNDFSATPLHGTLCKQVLQKGVATSLFGEDLRDQPLADVLMQHEYNSYFGVPLLDGAGQTIGLLASLSARKPAQSDRTLDILQAFAARASSELGRIISERRTRANFEQFATLFDSLNAIIYVADMDTYQLLYVNRFAENLFGNDWRDRKCYTYFQEGQDETCIFCTNAALLEDGQPGPPVTWEFCNTRNNRWYQCLDKCIQWTDGRLARLEIALDITPRKEMEQTKEELLSAVSHEMRTPLTAITGFAELLLEEEDLPSHVRHHVETIFNESEKMTDLVNTFLELRRLKADQSRVNYQRLDVRKLLEQGARTARDCAARHKVTIHCPDGLQVFGNPRELGQVVAKLLSNACRFSPEGGPVKLEAWREDDRAVLCFEDSGIGIPAEEHEQIFEHFHRLDRGDRRRTSGAGLGLSLVKQTVALHGGRVWLESTPGHGSRFFVSLPCQSTSEHLLQGQG